MANGRIQVQIVAYMLASCLALCQTTRTTQRPSPAKSRVLATPTSPVAVPHYIQGPFDSEKSNVAPHFLGHDPEALVAEIRDSGASKPKSEFETTAQYEARQTIKSLAGRRYVFVVDPEIGFHSLSGAEFTYDADEQVMTARLQIHKEELYDLQKSGGGSELNYALITKHTKPKVAKAIGTNAFGASVALTEYATQEHGIALMRLPVGLFSEVLPDAFAGLRPDLASELSKFLFAEAKVTIPMKADQAERLKPNLRFAVVGIVSEMRFFTAIEEKQATLSHPTSVIRGTDFVPIIPKQLLLFDFKTGEIFTRVEGTTSELSPILPGSPSVSSFVSGTAPEKNDGTDVNVMSIEKPSPPLPPKAPPQPSQTPVSRSPVSPSPSQILTPEVRVVSKCCFDLMATQGHLRIASPARARIQGTVRLKIVIGKDGVIQNLQLVSGHPMLVQSAIDAVKQWVYKPTLLNSEPVEVTRDVSVDFTLSQ